MWFWTKIKMLEEELAKEKAKNAPSTIEDIVTNNEDTEATLPTLAEAFKELQEISRQLDDLGWFITEEIASFIDSQTSEFMEKTSFFLVSLISKIGHAKDKERNADKRKLVEEITNGKED